MTSEPRPHLAAMAHPAPIPDHGRAGRNLPAAITVGVLLGAAIVGSLLYFKWGFVAIVAAALGVGAVELYGALRRQGMTAAIQPILGGTVAIVAGSYLAGTTHPVVISTNSVLLAALGATVIAALVWRMPAGQEGFVRDAAASLFIIAYVPLLGSFSALMLAAEHGATRVVSFMVVVVASDIGGYVAGVLFGRHPMAPKVSPKKTWEGLAGSLVLSTAAGIGMSVFALHAHFWVGIVLGVSLVFAATAGDLVESMIKRDVGIKDMSSFLPGHGGVMDRLDSLLLAAPVAWLILYLLVPGG